MAGVPDYLKAVFYLTLLLLSACGLNNNYAPVADRSEPSKVISGSYVVRPGDTLYAIAWNYGWDFRDLARVNKIKAPYNIFPGQKLYFKTIRLTKKSKKPSSKTASKNNQRNSASKKWSGSKVTWQQPVAGKIIRAFSTKSTSKNKGIDIAGYPGQAIQAAATGEVVYSGSGLLGYGQLIIIKHNSEYLSAYAHNRRILVKEGQKVNLGEKIGEMGSNGNRKAILHFEIRRSGKPIDPQRLLPKM